MNKEIDLTVSCYGKVLLACCGLISSMPVFAQQEVADTLSNQERRSNQNVLLNASSTSQPRTISLGIPVAGTSIVEDGLPVSMYQDFYPAYWTWRNGLATESMTVTRLDESAIMLGTAGFFAMSTSKAGADQFEGGVSYTLNHYGRHQLDVNVASPLGKGWGIDLNVYQDLNRGSNHLDVSYLQEQISYYKAAVSKKFAQDRGLFKLSYLYDQMTLLNDPYGPFIFNGDGSVSDMQGFKLGQDQYLPATATYQTIDLRTGQEKTRRYWNDSGIHTHVVTAGLNYQFQNGQVLDVNTRIRLGHCDLVESYLSGISQVTADEGYTYMNGDSFSGNLQNRFLFYYKGHSNEWFTTATLKGQRKNHEWLVGANAWFDQSLNLVETTNYAHQVKKAPEAILYQGQLYFYPNTNAQYIDGSQSRLAVYTQHQLNLSANLTMHLGLRAEYMGIRGESVQNLDGKTNNTRYSGWSLASPGVTLTPVKSDGLNGAASLIAYYKLNKAFGLELNAIATQQHTELWQYSEVDAPSEEPKRNYLLRGGFNYKNSWLDLQSLLTYIRQDNNYYTSVWTHQLTKAAGGFPAGYTEVLYMGSTYSMDAVGWTTDFILTPSKGFQFHGLVTLRSPQYRNYSFQPTFSDGYCEEYNFSGKTITTTSSVEIELEPSYQWNKWRVWASARYYSKQYVNITNSLYFKPRWETFAGVDYQWNDKFSLSVNVVNFLNETGASAGIPAASLATDPTPYRNYLTSGTYIRPFTLEFSTKLTF